MKIAHLVIGGEVAGGQLLALRFARAARARGDEAAFVSPTTGPFLDLVAEEGLPVRIVELGGALQPRALVELTRILRRERADLLHTHSHFAGNVVGRLAGRLAGVPVVAHMHIENHFRPGRLGGGAQRLLDNATARLCARILAVSEDTRRALELQGYPPRLLETVRNGIDLAADTPRDGLRAELGVPEDVPLAGEIGRLCAVKGQRELIRAAAEVPGLHVVLVGKDLETGGAFQRELEGEAKRLGVGDRVVFAGYRPDAREMLSALDVFVLPSWIEGLPIVVLEAMASGTPVVATPVGGTPELVTDGETGLLVPPRDPAALARALRRLVGDSALARRLGEAGRELVATRFSAQAMERRVLEVYDEIVRA